MEFVAFAPSLVPKQSGDKVKTDRRDALKLARFHRSGDLTEVALPDASTEAMRDLERARDDAKNAERVAHHQLPQSSSAAGPPLRREDVVDGVAHLIRSVASRSTTRRTTACWSTTSTPSSNRRRGSSSSRKTSEPELVATWNLQPLVKAFQALRGVRLVSAVILAAEMQTSRDSPPRRR